MKNILTKEELQTLFATHSVFHLVIASILVMSSGSIDLYAILFFVFGLDIISFVIFLWGNKHIMTGVALLTSYIFSEMITIIMFIILGTKIHDVELVSIIGVFLINAIIATVIFIFMYKKCRTKTKRFQLFIDKINNIDENEKITCCICLGEIEKTICSLKCNHKFHKKCVEDWLETNPTCPVCRDQNEKV